MAFQIKNLRDQEQLLIFQAEKSVRGKKITKKFIRDRLLTLRRKLRNQTAAQYSELSYKEPQKMVWWGQTVMPLTVRCIFWYHLEYQWGWYKFQPQSSDPAHAPLDKSGPVSVDVKAPEDANAVKLFQALPIEPTLCARQFLALLQVTLYSPQGLGMMGGGCKCRHCMLDHELPCLPAPFTVMQAVICGSNHWVLLVFLLSCFSSRELSVSPASPLMAWISLKHS